MCVLSCVQLFVTPWTVAHQAPLSVEFSRQKYWSGLPFPSPPRFHMYALIYIFLFLTYFTIQQILGPSLQMTQFCFFLWLSSSPYVPLLLYPLIYQWTWLLPGPGYCEWCCNEHLHGNTKDPDCCFCSGVQTTARSAVPSLTIVSSPSFSGWSEFQRDSKL